MKVEQWQKDQLAENLRYYIGKSGHSLRWTAVEAGMSDSALQSWTSGQSIPNAIQLKATANVLGTTVDMLLAGVTTIPVSWEGTSPLE